MDTTIKILEKIMDGCALRHKVLADNLANSETPNYKRKDVNFRKE
jgi:flagellar basal-body rod protein FlgB